MTETEWLGATDPYYLIQTARKGASERKQRLFAVGCCRRISHMLLYNEMRIAVEIGEQFADGLVTRDVCEAAHSAADELRDHVADAADAVERGSIPDELLPYTLAANNAGLHLDAVIQAADAASMVAQIGNVESAKPGFYPGAYYPAALAVGEVSSRVPKEAKSFALAEHAVQCLILRDIFGNPFRPVAVDPSWLTSTVTAIAEGIYAENAFDRMPILADALHDAGCDNEDVLTHCRSDKPHVKGCWVVDLLLGKQ